MNITYRLIAVDIDGTMLNSRSELTPRVRQAVERAVGAGVLFTISTGRPLCGVERLNLSLEGDLPVIAYNGAAVIMSGSKKVLFSRNLSPRLCRETVALGLERGVSVNIWVDDTLYAASDSEKNDKYRRISRFEPILGADIDGIAKNGASKVLWCDDAETIARLQDDMREWFKGRLNCHTSSPSLLEFVDLGASKAGAMEKLGEHFGIKRSEMIAIGDGYNDLSMLKYAGLGVAMANAPQAVKDMADYVTLSNDEDGVAHVIEKFILSNINNGKDGYHDFTFA